MARKEYFDSKETPPNFLISWFLSPSSFLSDPKALSDYWLCCFAMSVCLFNSLTNGVYSNILIIAAFCNILFSGKISPPIKNSYLLTFPDDKAKALALCLSKSN